MSKKNWIITVALVLKLLTLIPVALIVFYVYRTVTSFPLFYDKEEVAKEMRKYLKNKYEKEFTVTGVDRNCHEGDFDSCYRIFATASPKDNPHIKFEVDYYLEGKDSPSDWYRNAFWVYQFEREWLKEIKKDFQLGSKGGLKVEIADGRFPSNESKFQNYRAEIGKDIKRIYINVYKGDETKKRIGDPEVVKNEAESFIAWKKQLLTRGIKQSELKYFYVRIEDGWRDYYLTMDHVVDDPGEMVKRIRHIEPPGDTHDDYVTDTVPYYPK